MNVRGDELLEIFNRIDNPTDTLFIQLKYVADGDARLGFTSLRGEKCLATKRTTSKTKSKRKMPLVQNKRQCFIPALTLRNLEQYIDNKWPTGNDKKNNFCQGMRQLLDIASNSKIAPVPITTCHEEPMTDDISFISDIVKQKYPSKFDKVKKAWIEKD